MLINKNDSYKIKSRYFINLAKFYQSKRYGTIGDKYIRQHEILYREILITIKEKIIISILRECFLRHVPPIFFFNDNSQNSYLLLGESSLLIQYKLPQRNLTYTNQRRLVSAFIFCFNFFSQGSIFMGRSLTNFYFFNGNPPNLAKKLKSSPLKLPG